MHITGRVLVCDQIDHVGISTLKKAGMTVDYCPNIDGNEVISRVKDYDVIVVRSRTIISREVIDAATNAKIIARVGVGLDNIDIDAAKVKDMSVINASEAAINAVAELVIGNMISLARNITRADAEMKKGNWIKRDLIGTELSGKYLGLIGVGNIGRNVGRIARGLV